MLKRLVLATFCGFCLTGITYAQRVASKDATAPRDRGPQNERRDAVRDYGRALDRGDIDREIGAYDRVTNAESRAPRDMPDVNRDRLTGAREVDRSKDWDRNMSRDKEGPQRDRDRGRDRDKADKSDRGGGPDRSGRGDRSDRSDKNDRGERSGGYRDRN